MTARADSPATSPLIELVNAAIHTVRNALIEGVVLVVFVFFFFLGHVRSAVVVTGIAQISVVANGNPRSFGVRFTDVWSNKSGAWQMTAWQSTLLPA